MPCNNKIQFILYTFRPSIVCGIGLRNLKQNAERGVQDKALSEFVIKIG
jgi:hypothetical protein